MFHNSLFNLCSKLPTKPVLMFSSTMLFKHYSTTTQSAVIVLYLNSQEEKNTRLVSTTKACFQQIWFQHVLGYKICCVTQRGLFILRSDQRWQVMAAHCHLSPPGCGLQEEGPHLTRAIQTEPGLTQYPLLSKPPRGRYVWTVGVCLPPVRHKCLEGWSNTDWIRGLDIWLAWGGAGIIQRLHPNTFRFKLLLRFSCLKEISYRNVY